MNPDCFMQFTTYGQKVERVIVLVHDYTNCPAQFHESGELFYDWGGNVLLTPLPYWSLTDRVADGPKKIPSILMIA